MNGMTNFCLRGDRDYVSGATIFDAVRKHDPLPQALDVQFRKMTARQCVIETTDPPDRQGALVASYTSKGLRVYLYETAIPVAERRPCNEKEIISKVTFQDQDASCLMPAIPSCTPIEAFVAMYKYSLKAILPTYQKKYIWARLVADYLPESGVCMVRHQRRLGRDFFEGHLLHDGQPVGSIYFGAK